MSVCSFPTLLSLCEYKASRKSLSWKLRALSAIVAQSKSVLWTNWFACCALSVSPFVVLPYVRGVPEKISRVLHNNGVKVGYKPLNVLRTCFPRPKDKPPALQCRGVVYRVACIDCNFVYYGQTDRALETRLKEHKRAVRVGDNNSKVVQHANQFVHCIDFSHGTPPPVRPSSINWRTNIKLASFRKISFIYKTDEFHVSMGLFRSQKISNCDKNISDTRGYRLVCHVFRSYYILK